MNVFKTVKKHDYEFLYLNVYVCYAEVMDMWVCTEILHVFQQTP